MEMYFGCRWSKSLSVVTRVEFIAYVAGAIQRSFVSLRQSGVGPNKTCADATLPKGHKLCSFTLSRLLFSKYRLQPLNPVIQRKRMKL